MQFTLLSAVIFSALAVIAKAASNPDDPSGKVLYMALPSCDHYECKVKWHHGTTHKIMWWNAPQGDVKVQLVSEKDDGPTYTIKQKINGTVGQASCKSEAPKGETCGTFKWRVPNFVRPGEYSVAVTSISHPDKSGWTDTVVVSKATSRKTSSRRTDKARIE